MAVRVLLVKEVKDLLRDPRILVALLLPAVMLPVIGGVMSYVMETTYKETVSKPVTVAVVDLDRTPFTSLVLDGLRREQKVDIVRGPAKGLTQLLNSYDTLIVIPKGFTGNVTRSKKAVVLVVQRMRSLSTGGVEARDVSKLLETFNTIVTSTALNLTREEAYFAREPVTVASAFYIRSRKLLVSGSPQVAQPIATASFMVPAVLMIVGMLVLQMASTSMAMENEEKTLEVLLTLPIPRSHILLAKLLGAMVVALAGSVFSLVGLWGYTAIYMGALKGMLEAEGEARVNLTLALKASGLPTPANPLKVLTLPASSYALLGLSLVLSLFFLATLGIVVGALSSDVRMAGTISGPLIMPFLAGYFVATFMDPTSINLATRITLLLTPFTQPVVVSRLVLEGVVIPLDWVLVASSALLSLGMILLTARLLSLEILTRIQHSLSRIAKKRT